MVPCSPQKPLRPVVKKWCSTGRVRCQNTCFSSEALLSWCLGTFPCKTLQWKADSYLFIAKFSPVRPNVKCFYVKSKKLLLFEERVFIAITKCWPLDGLLLKFSASERSSCGWRNPHLKEPHPSSEHKCVLWSQAAKKHFYQVYIPCDMWVGTKWSLRSLPSQKFLWFLWFLWHYRAVQLITRKRASPQLLKAQQGVS